MRTYEAVFILDSKKIEDNGESFAKDIESQMQDLGGTVKRSLSLGRRQFARPIGSHRAGNYWDFVVDMAPESVTALKDRYRLNAAVLRLEVFLFDEDADATVAPRLKERR